ncbi:MAG: hypothetical protein WCW34_00840 [Patescibacteria group bacterium]
MFNHIFCDRPFKNIVVIKDSSSHFRAYILEQPEVDCGGTSAEEAIGKLLMAHAGKFSIQLDLGYSEDCGFEAARAQCQAELIKARAIIRRAGGAGQVSRRDLIEIASLPQLVIGDYMRLEIYDQMKEIREEAFEICLQAGLSKEDMHPRKSHQWIPAALLP